MSTESEARLARIQSTVHTPKSIIAHIVRNKLGQELIGLKRIIAGEANEVYVLSTLKGKYIIRISLDKANKFEKERQAKEYASKHGVPVAETLVADVLESNGQPRPYSLENFIEGNIYDLYSTNKQILEPIFKQAGEILGRLHEVKFSKFGDSSDNLGSGFNSFVEFIQKTTLASQDCFKEIASKHNLKWPLIEKMLKLVEANLSIFAEEPAVLTHGDFNHKHFIVDERLQIKAIIDWGECSSSTPIKDFGGWYFWFNQHFPVEVLTKNYANQSYFQDNFQLKLDLYALIKTLDLVYYYDEIDDPASFANISFQLGQCRPAILNGDFQITS